MKKPFTGFCFSLLACVAMPIHAIQLTGITEIHDPATIQKEENTYWTFSTSNGIDSRYSTDLIDWKFNGPIFPEGTWPNWINKYVKNFKGHFWAPDVVKMNGKYYLYYSAFATTDSSFESVIGVAVSDSLNTPKWRDLGMVVSSKTEPYSPYKLPTNTIDPGVFKDANDNVWMIYGSHYSGLFVAQIDPTTGKRMNNIRYPVAGNNGKWHELEAGQIQYINGYYYLFANLGDCCAGTKSTYYVVAGKSDKPTGPFLDKNGVDLYNGGGTTVLKTKGRYIGPGHFGYFNNNGQHLVSIHYYDGTTDKGIPRLDLLQMSFTNDWPKFTRNFTLQKSSNTVMTSIEGRVAIVSRLSGKVLDVEGGSKADNADIIQWTYDNRANQHFDLKSLGNGYYSIRASHSGKAVEVEQQSTVAGADIRQGTWTGGTHQQWKLIDVGAGFYNIVSRHSNLALDVFNFSTENGGDIRQWTHLNGINQQFQLKYVP